MPFNERVGVCFASLENTLRGDIRIDNHMKVGGSELESRFDHRFANMNLKTRFGFPIANEAVGTTAAVTQQVTPVSRMSAGRALFR